MNFIYLFIEVIIILALMILFYKFGKKDGLFLYISFMSGLLSIMMFKSIDILSFEIDLGVPFIMGIFVCSNVIVQRYGIDEIKKIIKSFAIPYLSIFFILSLVSLMGYSNYNNASSMSYDTLFGYNLENLRLFVAGIMSIAFSLWYNAYIYYYIRKSKNNYWLSNIGSMFVIQITESIIFVIIAYVGIFGFDMLFGIILIRYLFKIIIGLISLFPFVTVLKMKS